ncbi:single-stranded DNA-binding protein [Candidatus Saccharibacteria bacterium]|jgi:single-strand DNA-binding protein|nr:single-stranded DNA-binding protein [Candidatus Saccharibacteria bacterium]MBP9489157.1 single-stranded DNA-binding protein [Candidatus Saccharibacteria bacterium]MBP9552054.1 single-stranded DNA-binding protein [Candidatus Saccharibacteria bacterium]
MAFNKVVLLGNLTADPELRTTTGGQNVASFTIAISRTWNNAQGEKQEETSFINCTAWGRTGETIAKYVQKGRQLLVSGRLQQRTWQDKDTGKNRSAIDVIVEEFSFVSDGSRGGGSSSSSSASAKTNEPVIDEISDDPIDLSDIPF